MDEARNTLEKMMRSGTKPDVKYSSIVNGYAQKGMMDEAWNILEKMMRSGIKPNVVTYNSIVSGYAKKEMMDEAWNALDNARKWDQTRCGDIQFHHQ